LKKSYIAFRTENGRVALVPSSFFNPIFFVGIIIFFGEALLVLRYFLAKYMVLLLRNLNRQLIMHLPQTGKKSSRKGNLDLTGTVVFPPSTATSLY
jgi:hypothetical protein